MTDPAFNLAQLTARPNWYDYLHQVEAALAAEDRLYAIRRAAGWDADEGGWISPDGIPESDWEHEYGHPFPEDPDYPDFASAYFHYDATDADQLPELSATVAAVSAAQLSPIPK